MNGPKLPTLRLPVVSGGGVVIQDAVVLEQASSNSLIVAYGSEARTNTSSALASSSEYASFGASEGESSENDSAAENGEIPFTEEPEAGPFQEDYPPDSIYAERKHLSRTLSTPLPSQLSQLQNPHRPSPLSSSSPTTYSSPAVPTIHSNKLHEVSLELADSIQLAIQTMLQISPPQVLDPAKEHFSACSLSVPTSSMSAMFTAMKNLNYISANMSNFWHDIPKSVTLQGELPGPDRSGSPVVHDNFDIGELLQCVGDALSGAASQIGVDLVLYHGDAGLKHIYVSGDESGISYALSHIVRQILNVAQHGDTIELGLLVAPVLDTSSSSMGPTPEGDPRSNSPMDIDGPLHCTVRISHKYGSKESNAMDVSTPSARPQPNFSTILLRRLLRQIDASLNSNVPPQELYGGEYTCDFTVVLERGSCVSADRSLVDQEANISDPTVEQLAAFGESLKGKRITLYASPKGSFAQHLTSYLTAWGMDVTHVSPDGNADGLIPRLNFSASPDAESSRAASLTATYMPNPDVGPPSGVPPTVETRRAATSEPSFIFIDDDINVLRERLQALREERLLNQIGFHSRNRPSLAAHHRPRSSPHIARLLGHPPPSPPAPVVILHFTSLSNYKIVKDIIQSVILSYATSSAPLPEVMIIPKPAGPRRFLTALHTAVTKPDVDPFFTPIATAPSSPGLQLNGSFFSPRNDSTSSINPQPHSPAKNHRPIGSRSNSDRSTRSGKDKEVPDHVPLPPPSPLGLSDNVEYFSEAAVKLGQSPSSGLVIQSPDGQPAGIFFHPRVKNSRNPSSQSMERDKGQLQVPLPRKVSAARTPSPVNPDTVTFSSLHETSMSSSPADLAPAPSPTPVPKRKPLSPRAQEQVSLPSPPTTTTLRKSSTDTIHRQSPPLTSPQDNTPSKRALGKRPANEESKNPTPSKKKGKTSAASENDIVPPISVLIVDDNPINQTILSTFMRRKKIKYDIANNGLEAVQKWQTGGFHLILMDIQMPIMDGIEATKEIRRLEKSNASAGFPPLTPSEDDDAPSTTPSDAGTSSSMDTKSSTSPYRSSVIIVALTASSLQSDRVAALAAGCNDFLTKPVTLSWLNNKIIEWGSIKALQMWADLKPDAILATGQAAQARNVAERLHVPKGRASPVYRPPIVREGSSSGAITASPSGSDGPVATAGISSSALSNIRSLSMSSETRSHSQPSITRPWISPQTVRSSSFEFPSSPSIDSTEPVIRKPEESDGGEPDLLSNAASVSETLCLAANETMPNQNADNQAAIGSSNSHNSGSSNSIKSCILYHPQLEPQSASEPIETREDLAKELSAEEYPPASVSNSSTDIGRQPT